MFPRSFPQPRQQPALSGVIITSSGQLVCPPGVFRAKLTLIGAGANSGTSTSNYGPGGPAAGTAIKWIDMVPGATYNVVIGAIGALAGAGTTTLATTGGASTFSGPNIGTITANGGQSSGSGGTATGGDINITGGSAPLGGVSGGIGVPLGGASHLPAFGNGGSAPATGAAANPGMPGAAILEF